MRLPRWYGFVTFCLLTPGLAAAASGGQSCAEVAQRYENKSAGRVVTVLGEIEPDEVGETLMHEHLFVNFFASFAPATDASSVEPGVILQMQRSGWPVPRTPQEARFFNAPTLTLDMLPAMRKDVRVRTNYLIDESDDVAGEVRRFVAIGGKTIVDQTPEGLGRSPERLARFSRQAGVQVVMGTGWYRWPFVEEDVQKASADTLCAKMVRDLLEGSGKVRSGIIGEIPLDSRSIHIEAREGQSLSDSAVAQRSLAARKRLMATPVEKRDELPLEDIYDRFELTQLRAAARASRLTGAPLSLHVVDAWTGFLSVVEEEGLPLNHVIVSHAHPILEDPTLLRRTLARGVVLQADYQLQHYPMRAPLGDLDAIADGIAWAVRNGHIDQITLSLDLCNKVGLQRYGGGGYTTLHDFVLPALRARGLTAEQLHHIMVKNPARLLAWQQPPTTRGREPAPPGSLLRRP
jgi:phosphotriesterase-related protein